MCRGRRGGGVESGPESPKIGHTKNVNMFRCLASQISD